MPTATATAERRPAKATPPQDFLTRLENFGKHDIEAAIVAYRALVAALADDPKHDADEAHVFEILDALKITRADLANDIATVLCRRTDEAQVMTQQQYDQSLARGKEAAEKLKLYLEEIPKLKGLVRYEEGLRTADAHLRGDLGRRKLANCRLYGDPSEVERRVEQGLPTGPRADGKAGGYVPAMSFAAVKR